MHSPDRDTTLILLIHVTLKTNLGFLPQHCGKQKLIDLGTRKGMNLHLLYPKILLSE